MPTHPRRSGWTSSAIPRLRRSSRTRSAWPDVLADKETERPRGQGRCDRRDPAASMAGTNGLADRRRYLEIAKSVLSSPETLPEVKPKSMGRARRAARPSSPARLERLPWSRKRRTRRKLSPKAHPMRGRLPLRSALGCCCARDHRSGSVHLVGSSPENAGARDLIALASQKLAGRDCLGRDRFRQRCAHWLHQGRDSVQISILKDTVKAHETAIKSRQCVAF